MAIQNVLKNLAEESKDTLQDGEGDHSEHGNSIMAQELQRLAATSESSVSKGKKQQQRKKQKKNEGGKPDALHQQQQQQQNQREQTENNTI